METPDLMYQSLIWFPLFRKICEWSGSEVLHIALTEQCSAAWLSREQEANSPGYSSVNRTCTAPHSSVVFSFLATYPAHLPTYKCTVLAAHIMCVLIFTCLEFSGFELRTRYGVIFTPCLFLLSCVSWFCTSGKICGVSANAGSWWHFYNFPVHS